MPLPRSLPLDTHATLKNLVLPANSEHRQKQDDDAQNDDDWEETKDEVNSVRPIYSSNKQASSPPFVISRLQLLLFMGDNDRHISINNFPSTNATHKTSKATTTTK